MPVCMPAMMTILVICLRDKNSVLKVAPEGFVFVTIAFVFRENSVKIPLSRDNNLATISGNIVDKTAVVFPVSWYNVCGCDSKFCKD